MSNWITVITFIYPHEAHIAKSVLESEDIPVFIKDELTAQVNNFYSTAIGGVKVQVPETEKEKAIELLREAGFIKEEAKSSEPESFFNESSNCPYCNSDNILKQKKPGYVTMLSILLLGLPLPFFKNTYHCFECGKDWKSK